MTENIRASLKDCRRFIVKIGSSSLTTENGLNYRVIDRLCDELALLKDNGREFAFVSSGAVAAGRAKVNLKDSPKALARTQAMAAIGQGSLIRGYHNAFKRYGHIVAQILITRDDLDDRQRYLNIRNTFTELFELGVIPIINENDTVSVDELQFSDNDMLTAMVAPLVSAQAMIILTDTDGVYDMDPRTASTAKRIPEIAEIKRKDLQALSAEAGNVGRGGMQSKLKAAYHAAALGIPTVVASAYHPQVITAILNGDDVGTLIHPRRTRKMTQKDHWIGLVSRPKGRIVVDAGAARMLLEQGKSLLPCGVVATEKNFKKGDPVEIADESGNVLAVGLSNFTAEEVLKIKGAKTRDVCRILEYECYEEIVHRNNMTIKKEMI